VFSASPEFGFVWFRGSTETRDAGSKVSHQKHHAFNTAQPTMARPVRAAAARARAATRQADRAVRSDTASDSEASVVVVSDDDGAFDPTAKGRVSPTSSPSIISISDSESDAGDEKRGTKRKRTVRATGRHTGKKAEIADIEDCVPRPHGPEYHSIDAVVGLQNELLKWFESVRCVKRQFVCPDLQG